ncbi:hypothetical protein GN958_ATG20110 [Phytophthora infestans]|uniref:Auto-transporter adhesin head GIN domain-containing protein n=1 Tax=Phytophthora infestans TaxID=4787 RepID=A0A8S9TP25_PHYIN|nr:hypothetical protein GN958_ATG20110 [Phytophthora infestans]
MVSLSRLPLLLLLVALTSTGADSDFSVSSTSTESVDSSTEHVSFVKQWTLTATNSPNNNNDDDDDNDSDDGDDKIDTIKLQLPGRVFVSYSNSLPSGVLGYVNVSGDFQTVVDTVRVSSNDDDEELEVKFDGRSTSSTWYLMTEIFLATSNVVDDVEIESTAEVIIEDGVLVASNTNKEVQIKAKDSSVVYVSSSALSLQDLKLELSNSATLQLSTDSITLREDGQFQAHDKASINVVTPFLTVDDLDLDAENSGTICISATDVKARNFDGQDRSRISLPNASSKYTSTGTGSCEKTSIPSRVPACVSNSACSSTTNGSSTTSASNASTATSVPSSSTTSAPSADAIRTSEQTSDAVASTKVYAVGMALTTGLLIAVSL